MIRTAVAGVLFVGAAMVSVPVQEAIQGWGITHAPLGRVSRIYWELQPTTEVLLPLVPVDPDGKPLRVHLVFHAFFPGRAERDWSTGQPAWPKGTPARLAVTAQAFPLTFAIPEFSLSFTIDDRVVEVTTPGRYRNIPCLIATEGCTPDGVEADLDVSVLRSLATARQADGRALGFAFRLSRDDQAALTEFLERIGAGAQVAGGRRQVASHRCTKNRATV